MIDISLIVPVYNIPIPFLEKCFESIIKQDKTNIEVIIINDGSDTKISNYIEKFAENQPDFHVVHIKNSGVSVARNIGIEKARGEWIAFIDSDDWIDEKYLSTMWDKVKYDDRVDICISNCIIDNGSSQVENIFIPSDVVEFGKIRTILIGQLISKKLGGYYPKHIAAGVPWSKIFRKEFIIRNNIKFIPDLRRMQDNVFCFEAYCKSKSIVTVNHFGYHYRKDDSSATNRYNDNIQKDFDNYFTEVDKIVNSLIDRKSLYKSAIFIKRMMSFHSYMKNYYFHPKNTMNDEINFLNWSISIDNEMTKNHSNNIDFKLMTLKEKVFFYFLKYKFYNFFKLIYKRNEKWKK